MASKQLGKLRQWAGEVISSKDKTSVSDEFKEQEKNVEIRKLGMQRLYSAINAYQYTLSKKKEYEGPDGTEKLMPIDALGSIMVVHGEEMRAAGSGTYGESLYVLGRAHTKVATLQEAFCLNIQHGLLSSLDKWSEDVKEYEAQRRKLESRRLAYDAALTKEEKMKSSKKESDRQEAEEELEKAKERYEETAEDLRGFMQLIQDNEFDQQRELTAFLDSELHFIEQYASILSEVRSTWVEELPNARNNPVNADISMHNFSRTAKDTPKFSSIRSRRSTRSNNSTGRASNNSDDDGDSQTTTSKKHKRGASSNGKTPSRPNSRASTRKRSDSNMTARDEDDKEKADMRSKRMTMPSWASSIGRSKKKEKFESLRDGGGSDSAVESDEEPMDDPPRPRSRSQSFKKMMGRGSPPKSSPKVPSRVPVVKKTCRALYDYSPAKSDELRLTVGDEIIVLSEVLDDWWLGEVRGERGLFPTAYTKLIVSPLIPAQAPRLPQRPSFSRSLSGSVPAISPSEEETQRLWAESSDDDVRGVDSIVTSARSPFYGRTEESSIIDTTDEEDDHLISLPPLRGGPTQASGLSVPTLLVQSGGSPMLGASGRKPPPPPPPPRRTATQSTGPSPAIPPRIPGRTQSSGALGITPSSSVSSHDYDVSPFESAIELGPCSNFQQNPFKPKGMCNNCFNYHKT